MTNDEAKFILTAYRPGGHDASDPAFAAALAQAKNDPALGAWWAREQSHGAAVAARLKEIAPPPGLREAILAGAHASENQAPRARRSLPVWMAAAAGVMVLLSLGVLWWGRPLAADRLADLAFEDIAHGRHGGHGAATSALQAMLSNPATRLATALPIDFSTLKSTGCRTMRIAGHEVLEVCFQRGGAEFHLYIAQRSDFAATKSDLQFREQAMFSLAAWADDAHRFVLVTDAGIDVVKRLL